MATDFYMTDSGDLAVSSKGDIAITPSTNEQIRQQSLLRLATQRGDFVPYKMLGGDLQKLVGLPNVPKVARYGENLINRTLTYDGFLESGAIAIEATPTKPDIIEFETKIMVSKRDYVTITLEQLLTI
jgi:hypothetical protein